MNKITVFLALAIFFNLSAQMVKAENTLFDMVPSQQTVNADVDSLDFFKNKFLTANEKFRQGNVTASYDDFKTLIENCKGKDFYLVLIALKTSEYGMFDLAQDAFKATSDKFTTSVYRDNLNKFYYSSSNLKKEDEIYLSEAYSSIFYNNLMLETVSELKKKSDILIHSDYANYLMALAYYKVHNSAMAQKYIAIARAQNPGNLNYKCLQALILSKTSQNKLALKLINEVKKENLSIKELQDIVLADEYLVEYNSNTNQALKDYNLAYYYYVSNEPQKALRLLITLQTKKKKIKADSLALMSRVYFDTYDFEKAYDCAQKSLKINSKQSLALETIGDLKYKNAKYKNALTYYKKIQKIKNSQNISLKLFRTYQKLEKYKKANELMLKNLKGSKVIPEFYIEKAQIAENDKVMYAKKALSYNMEQKNAWYLIAQEMLKANKKDMAENCLKYAYYIDENDFRYYYYQSLIKREEGQIDEAIKLLNKSNKLNPNFKSEKESM